MNDKFWKIRVQKVFRLRNICSLNALLSIGQSEQQAAGKFTPPPPLPLSLSLSLSLPSVLTFSLFLSLFPTFSLSLWLFPFSLFLFLSLSLSLSPPLSLSLPSLSPPLQLLTTLRYSSHGNEHFLMSLPLPRPAHFRAHSTPAAIFLTRTTTTSVRPSANSDTSRGLLDG